TVFFFEKIRWIRINHYSTKYPPKGIAQECWSSIFTPLNSTYPKHSKTLINMYMMKARKFILPMVAVGSILLIGACNSEKIAALPDPPASTKQVEALVKEKKFSVKELGFYG